MALAGVSTIGILFGWAAETESGVKPVAFKQLTRIASVGEITLSSERLDASTLEDTVTRYIAGRADSGGSFDVVVNMTDATIAEWEEVISTYETLTDGKELWFEVWSPYRTKAFFAKAQPPLQIPMPSFEGNNVETVTIPLTITEYVGLDTAIKPTEA